MVPFEIHRADSDGRILLRLHSTKGVVTRSPSAIIVTKMHLLWIASYSFLVLPEAVPPEAIQALEARADVLARWLVFWTALVVLGLMMEYGAEFAKWKPANVEHPHSFAWIWLCGKLGAILVVGGVAGEMYVASAAFRVETDLREKNHQNEAWLSKEAGDAKTSAEGAAVAAARAKSSADDVAKQAARLRAQLVKQDLRAHLLEGKQRREAFKKRIKGFSGQTFDIKFCPNPDHEMISLSMNLWSIIEDGSWQLKEIGKTLGCSTGVTLVLDPRASKSTESAAAALQVALFEVGLVKTPKPAFVRSAGRPAAPGEILLEPSGVDTILVFVQAHP